MKARPSVRQQTRESKVPRVHSRTTGARAPRVSPNNAIPPTESLRLACRRQALNGLHIAVTQAGAGAVAAIGDATIGRLTRRVNAVREFHAALIGEAGKALGSGVAALKVVARPLRALHPGALALDMLLMHTRNIVAFLEVRERGFWGGERGLRDLGAPHPRHDDCRAPAARAPRHRRCPRPFTQPRPRQGFSDLGTGPAMDLVLRPHIAGLKVIGTGMGFARVSGAARGRRGERGIQGGAPRVWGLRSCSRAAGDCAEPCTVLSHAGF